MLNASRRPSPQVFGKNSLKVIFDRSRRRIVTKLQNIRLLGMNFYTLIYWKTTIECHKTKDIVNNKEKLGHKSINNTMIYTRSVTFEPEDHTSKTAKDIREAQKLVKAGFEYMCDFEEEGKSKIRTKVAATLSELRLYLKSPSKAMVKAICAYPLPISLKTCIRSHI